MMKTARTACMRAVPFQQHFDQAAIEVSTPLLYCSLNCASTANIRS
jgi:hypothetical protein